MDLLICPNAIPIDDISFSTACRSTSLLSMNDALAHLTRKQIILHYYDEIKKGGRKGVWKGGKREKDGRKEGMRKEIKVRRKEGEKGVTYNFCIF